MKSLNIEDIETKILDLESQLTEAKNLIRAIRHGQVDALLLNKDGKVDVYSLENIDYTYRLLIEKFAEGAISISPNGLIRFCNAYFADLLNIPIPKIVGTYFFEYLSAQVDFQSILVRIKNGIYKGEVNLEVAGKIIPVYISLTSLAPNLTGYGIILNDLTEKKKSEETILTYQKQLEQKIRELYSTNSDLEQFVHIVSHDIKEPLRKIISYGTLLKDDFGSEMNEGALNCVQIMNGASLRLNTLVDDLAHYSYIGSENSIYEPVDLNEVLEDILEDIEILVKSKSAKVTWSVLPLIKASKFQMRQLFSNLLINALKYSREDLPAEVFISAEITEDPDGIDGRKILYHKINVSDNGIGMEKKHLNKIFIIFQRLHGIKEYSGTGIGLAICKKIIENHHGKIDVSSVINEGSVFSVSLPLLL